ncbi:MAG: ABC transporter ATP-binding protein [Flavobacteriales bacterium]|nr:ABC transporter ATP-binding protein [Flavobacteriales bacterium]
MKFKDRLILNNINLKVEPSKTVGILGASGSGKSMLLWTILNLVSKQLEVNGTIHFKNIDLRSLSESEITRIRGNTISMIYQEPSNSFNPLLTIGSHIVETIRNHKNISKQDAKKRALEFLSEVGLEERVFGLYAHQVSGGMAQRAAIAMAICTDPEIILADEPTSSLDQLNENQIVNLLMNLRQKRNVTILLVSHDIDVIKKTCDELIVLENGEIQENGETKDLLKQPKSEFLTKALDNRLSRMSDASMISEDKALECKGVYKWYKNGSWNPFSNKKTNVLQGVDLQLKRGEILGLIGNSGSGKSTLARLLVQLESPSMGKVLGLSATRKVRAREIQMIFQDPHSSLNPGQTIRTILSSILQYHQIVPKMDIDKRIDELLKEVGLDKNILDRKPDALSGGQKQRVCIARAVALKPKIIICDECVSALDQPNRKQILDLLLKLKKENNMTLLFISHDLKSVAYTCNRIMVIHDGRIVEEGSVTEILESPQDSYTQELVTSADFEF